MSQRRTVFFVSDGTGITAQILGHSLLTQFEGVDFNQVTLPFVDSAERAEECLRASRRSRPAAWPADRLFHLVNQDVRQIVRRANALFLDFFETFIDPLEAVSGSVEPYDGRSHSAMDKKEYSSASRRSTSPWRTMTALASRAGAGRCDPDRSLAQWQDADQLYLALQFGVKAANYPLIPRIFQRGSCRGAALHKGRLYGSPSHPSGCTEIRQERRPTAATADLDNCATRSRSREPDAPRSIRSINSTSKSIEEIATTILRELRISAGLLRLRGGRWRLPPLH